MSAAVSSFQCATKIIFGVGAHQRLAEIVRERASKRWLILLDPALADSAIYAKVAAILARSDAATSVFTSIGPAPTDDTVQAALAAAHDHGAQTLLAIGGPSTLEVAKAVSVLMNGARSADIEVNERFCGIDAAKAVDGLIADAGRIAEHEGIERFAGIDGAAGGGIPMANGGRRADGEGIERIAGIDVAVGGGIPMANGGRSADGEGIERFAGIDGAVGGGIPAANDGRSADGEGIERFAGVDAVKVGGISMAGGGRGGGYQGIGGFSSSTMPMIAIPTIAGAAVAVEGGGSAILDPLAVSSMSASDAAYEGMEAFVRGFESYLSRRATVFSDALNVQAMTLIAGSIRAFVADRNNTMAAMDVLCGSSLAAMSISVTGQGTIHRMATSVAKLFSVPQGLASAVCLPHVAAFNARANPERYAKIAAILGIDGSGRSDAQGGAQAIHGLRALCSDLGIPPRLRDIGVTDDSLDDLSQRSFATANDDDRNPSHTGKQDFRALFEVAF